MADPTIIKKVNQWESSTNSNIERLMDDAAYSSAHPDDTLVLVGPPRIGLVNSGASDTVTGNLDAVGMVQNIMVNQQKPFQPLMALGSSRSFFVGGKAQGSAQIQRLFVNTDNLLRRLYANAIDQQGIDPNQDAGGSGQLDDNPAGSIQNPNYLINLDSEFFMVPFGMGIIFKNKARGGIGGLYMELCVIPSFSIAVQAGSNAIFESVNLFFDRVVPMPVTGNNSMLESFKKILTQSEFPA
jgi:hypothetical protein